jgi:hypothetical protein
MMARLQTIKFGDQRVKKFLPYRSRANHKKIMPSIATLDDPTVKLY